ncbi:P450 oxygenase [Cladorrhinum sp. PSN332]|nr:P450 oxygenase [Cladorrhinum sp. PSN332]
MIFSNFTVRDVYAPVIWISSLSLRWRTAIVIVVLYTLKSLLFPPKSPLEKLGIPLVKGKLDSVKKIKEYAKKYPDSAYRFRAFGVEYVVLPFSFYNEVKRIPESRASLLAFFKEAFNKKWSGMPSHTPEMMRAVSVDLSRNIPFIIEQRQKDCAKAIQDNIGDCPDWKEITVYKTVQNIATTINACALVGSELGHSRSWIRNSQMLTVWVAFPTFILSFLPSILKPTFKPFLFIPIRYTRFALRRLLTPVIKKELAQLSTVGEKPTAIINNKMALSSFLLNRYPRSSPIHKNPILQIVSDVLDISLESTPSTSGTIYWILVELAAADPSLVAALREEITTVTNPFGGKLPATQLNELRLMDSVMRESIRVNCFSHVILYRRLLSPLTLTSVPNHKIPTLPRGTTICVEAHSINFSPEYWKGGGGGKDPYEFDPYRHFNARTTKGNENKFKFANLGADSPHWGDGPQACPGRMFADNTIKIALTHILMNYDLRFVGEKTKKKPEKGQMPNGSMCPDMSFKLEFRNRRV